MRVEVVALAILVPLVLVLGAVLVRWPGADVADSPSSLVASSKVFNLTVNFPESGKQYNVLVKGETTVEQVLVRATEQYGLLFDTKDYGEDLGVFVEAINGVAGDADRGTYWHFYVNDTLSPVGASAAMVKPGDEVTWKYERQHEEN